MRIIGVLWFLFLSAGNAFAQCPSNIDFENGNFDGWTFYSGSVSIVNGVNTIDLTPAQLDGTHLLMAANPGNGLDHYGHFPKNCPNGSGYSLQLGDTEAGARADGASYTFTIPPGQDEFSITYYYAIVYANPSHGPEEQPRMEVEVRDMTDNEILECSSFTFVAGGSLPGFFPSPGNAGVLCRDWSANSIKLDGNAGKTFQLFFKVADCTLGGHFGYAYIDVDTRCSSNFPGSSFCAGDTSVDVSAPIGYQQYAWHFSGNPAIIGTTQQLHLAPAPPSGTVLTVDLTPYPGYGCSDQLNAIMTANLVVMADAGPPKVSCNNAHVQIGNTAVPGVVYDWQPVTGLSNSHLANPLVDVTALTNSTTTFTLTAKSPGGGCISTATTTVTKTSVSDAITLLGNNPYCEGSGQNTVLQVSPADSIQWYHDGVAIPGPEGVDQTQYTVTQTGGYSAQLFSLLAGGCSVTTAVKSITVYPAPVVTGAVDNAVQCFPGNNFSFTGNAMVASGTLTYLWDFGDGKTATTLTAAHAYTYPGNYNVKFSATGTGGCSDDTTIVITVKPGAIADFSALPVCVNLPLQLTNNTNAPGANTVNYLWDFGNTETSGAEHPTIVYTTPGTYTIKLSASTPECPDATVKERQVIVDKPAANIRYADHPAIINFPEELDARRIGNAALWSPATNLNNPHSYSPFFKGELQQLYTITLTTMSGCVTVDTVLVKPYKKIAINMPTAFTPNGDGKNDLLRPALFGFKKINYFKVYNRWGKLVFQTENDGAGWDGTMNGIKQDTQTFVWMIEATDVDGQVHTQSGTILLIR